MGAAPTNPVARLDPHRRADPPAGDVLDHARSIVDGRRHDEYGNPERNLTRIGQAWSSLLGLEEPLGPDLVALMLAAMKLVRAAGRNHEDDLPDAAGYVLLASRARLAPSNEAS